MELFSFTNRIDQAEMLRELIYIVADCEAGTVADWPADPTEFSEFLYNRIQSRRRGELDLPT